MTHDHVKGLDDLKDKTILVATPAGRRGGVAAPQYGYTDAQTKAYTFNLQPFFQRQERRAAVLSVVGPFPGDAEGRTGQVLPMADDGYRPTAPRWWLTQSLSRRTPGLSRAALCGPRSKAGRVTQGRPLAGQWLIKEDIRK